MSILKLGCIITTSMTLGAVIGFAVSKTYGMPHWVGAVAGGLLGILAALLAAGFIDRLPGQFDESIHPYG